MAVGAGRGPARGDYGPGGSRLGHTGREGDRPQIRMILLGTPPGAKNVGPASVATLAVELESDLIRAKEFQRSSPRRQRYRSIDSCITPRALLELVEQHSHLFSLKEVTACMTRLVAIAGPLNDRSSSPPRPDVLLTVRCLLSLVEASVDRIDARGQANVLWAIAKLERGLALTENPDSKHCKLVASMVIQHCTATVPPLLDSMNPQELSNAVWAVGSLKLDINQSTTTALVLATQSKLETLNPAGLSSVMWAWGRLGVAPPRDWLDHYLHVSSQGMSLWESRHVANSLWAMAELRIQLPSDSPWMLGVLSHAESNMHSFTALDISQTLWALVVLDQRPSTAWTLAAFQAVTSTLPNMAPQELSNTLWALATLKWSPEVAWLDAVEAILLGQMDSLGEQALSMCSWSLAKMGHSPSGEWLEAWSAACTALLPTMQPQAISNCVWAQLLWYPSAQFAALVFVTSATSYLRRHVSSTPRVYSSNNLVVATWALAKLGYAPGADWMELDSLSKKEATRLRLVKDKALQRLEVEAGQDDVHDKNASNCSSSTHDNSSDNSSPNNCITSSSRSNNNNNTNTSTSTSTTTDRTNGTTNHISGTANRTNGTANGTNGLTSEITNRMTSSVARGANDSSTTVSDISTTVPKIDGSTTESDNSTTVSDSDSVINAGAESRKQSLERLILFISHHSTDRSLDIAPTATARADVAAGAIGSNGSTADHRPPSTAEPPQPNPSTSYLGVDRFPGRAQAPLPFSPPAPAPTTATQFSSLTQRASGLGPAPVRPNPASYDTGLGPAPVRPNPASYDTVRDASRSALDYEVFEVMGLIGHCASLMTTQQLSSCLEAAASMGYKLRAGSTLWSQNVSSALALKIPTMGPKDLGLCVWALAWIGFRPTYSLRTLVCQRTEQLFRGSFDPVLPPWSLSGPPLKASETSLEGPPMCAETVLPADVCRLMYGLTIWHAPKVDELSVVGKEGDPTRRGYAHVPAHIRDTLWEALYYDVLPVHQEEKYAELAEVWSPKDIAHLLWCGGRLGAAPPAGWLAAAWKLASREDGGTRLIGLLETASHNPIPSPSEEATQKLTHPRDSHTHSPPTPEWQATVQYLALRLEPQLARLRPSQHIRLLRSLVPIRHVLGQVALDNLLSTFFIVSIGSLAQAPAEQILSLLHQCVRLGVLPEHSWSEEATLILASQVPFMTSKSLSTMMVVLASCNISPSVPIMRRFLNEVMARHQQGLLTVKQISLITSGLSKIDPNLRNLWLSKLKVSYATTR
eukprot:gene9716-7587_t